MFCTPAFNSLHDCPAYRQPEIALPTGQVQSRAQNYVSDHCIGIPFKGK